MLRVMTWNLWWRFGPWWQRQGAIEHTLAEVDADVIGIQEVWAETEGANQAKILARRLGYHYAHPQLRFGANGVAFTNAVLSRWPISEVHSIVLPRADGTPSHRCVVAAEIDAPFGRLVVASTHLDWQFDASADRVAQAAAVARFVDRLRPDPASGFPAVLLGDLNAVPHSDEIRSLTGATAPPVRGLVFTDAWDVAGGNTPGNTWCGSNPHLADATWPNRRIDYVLVSWPRPKPVGTVTSVRLAGTAPVGGVFPSDHYAVVAELRTA